MAVNVNGYIKLLVNLLDLRTSVTGAAIDAGRRVMSAEGSWTVVTGTAAGLADKVWADRRTVTTGATDSIDLAGTLTNAFAETVTFVKVKAIAVIAAAANTTTLQVARPASNGVPVFAAISDALAPLSKGGFFVWADPEAGVAVTAGTGDLLSIINSAGASAVYDIIIVGTSA